VPPSDNKLPAARRAGDDYLLELDNGRVSETILHPPRQQA
jgi:hypothetical protein